MIDYIMSKYNYWIYIALMMIGFYDMMGKKNLVKKLIGMNIFETVIIIYYIFDYVFHSIIFILVNYFIAVN